ncbi:flagellar biosynthetic protein FliR [Thiogranum longum]|uniref:Flagellar biosynthetic protein FliR n=1 Tax=Thiogranum longum TaxID=1537524 RepID=A0A4R1HNJ0_9GAMM|nr:flagellar biosynthetic protein FliR [Thiogranum longum]TCK18832.1 flagellar biosynthetic protein FliR [Thiogranum longum]
MLFTTADITSWIGTFFWPFVRIAAMLAIAPIFGAKMVPVRARLVIALLMTWIIIPLIPPIPAADPLSASGVLVTIQQMLIGMAIGFSLQLVFATLVIAGQTIAMGMGLGFAQMVDPQNGINVPVIGQYFVVIATLLFLALNGHLALIRILADSFQSLPIGTDSLTREEFRNVAEWGTRMFADAMMVALPAVASILLVNLSFGVVSRSAPQLNVFGVGFPVTLTLGFIVLVFAISNLLPQMQHLLDGAFGAASSFGSGGR